MAFSIEYVYKAIDSFSPVAKRINSVTKKLSLNVSRLTKKFSSLGRTFSGVKNKLTSGFAQIGAAAATFFGVRAVIQTVTSFEDAMADLSAITGATGKDLLFFEKQAIKLASTAVTAQSEVAGALKIVASAKSELLKDPKGLIEVTKQVLLLKNASGIELADAARVTTEALNQFGAGADQASRFVNVLAAGSKVGASEVAETGVAIVKSGVAAKLAGVGFEQLNSLIQVLAKNGIKAELAGTGLKTALLSLETAGIKQIQPSVVGMSKALENLSKANLDAAQLEKLFGREALSVGGILIDNVGLVNKWTKELTGTSIAQEQASIRLATLSKKWEKLGIMLKSKIIKAFDVIKPKVIAITNFLINLKNEVAAFTAEHPKLTKFAKTVALVAVTFGALALAVAATIGATTAAIALIALITSPIALVIGGISTLIFLVSEFSGRWSELPGAAIGALSEIWDFIASTNPLDALFEGFKSLSTFVSGTGLLSASPATVTSKSSIINENTVTGKSSLDVNINLQDREGIVQGVATKGSGLANLNVGKNLR